MRKMIPNSIKIYYWIERERQGERTKRKPKVKPAAKIDCGHLL